MQKPVDVGETMLLELEDLPLLSANLIAAFRQDDFGSGRHHFAQWQVGIGRYLELRLTPSSTIANLMVATQEAEDWAQQTGNEEARFNRWVDAVLQLEEACIGKAETWPTVQRLYQEVQ
jgi:hypothetical protein